MMMIRIGHFLGLAVVTAMVMATTTTALADDEREVTEEQKAAIAGAVDETEKPARPDELPDFTKGAPVSAEMQVWSLGPTGMVGVWAGGFGGDQFLVQTVLPGSPAVGKILPGDVLLGLNGSPFKPGGHLGVLFGNAIIEAEREENGGKLALSVWRDRNYSKRNATLDTDRVNLEEVFKSAEDGDALYDWKAAEEKKAETARQKFDEFPIDGFTLDVELKLRTFPPYADTAPFNCPKTMAILEDAWKVLEKKFIKDPKVPNSGRGGTTEALALLASGKPEHRKLLYDWVRSPYCKQWQPEFAGSIDMMKPSGGKITWTVGFVGLPCAIYYDCTGDEYVLPALKEWAVKTAMGQSGGGTWGHMFAWPSFNGGELHGSNPGYGGLNCAGVHCFFLLALAKKHGIEHPEIDAAIARSHRFFSSFVDQGAIGYGDHPAADTDDSNGKNAGTAFAMKLIGDTYAAKYFATMSAHASFTARGGHGHDWHTNWSCWAASLVGDEARIAAERNMRWRRTLCRRHDGSFVYHSPSIKHRTLRDPTATEVLHQAVALRQTLITGKDPDKSLWLNDREFKQLMASAQGQFNDPWLDAKVGTPWPQRSTDELFDLLDIFMPKTRRFVAAELGKRFKGGEKEIAPRLLALLESDNPRLRDGGLRGLHFCGPDTVLANLSTITKRLNDSHDFVRKTAVGVVEVAAMKTDTQEALLAAAAADPKVVAPNSVRNDIQLSLFAGDTSLAKSPFKAGFDERLVREALDGLLTLDPVGGRGFLASRVNVWEKDTVVRLASPLVFIAEEEQVNDTMFAGRVRPARAILQRHDFREGFDGALHLLRRQAALPRHMRPYVTMRYSILDPMLVKKHPGVFRDFMPAFHTVLIDNPVATVTETHGTLKIEVPLFSFLSLIAAAPPVSPKPSIEEEVRRVFTAKLEAAGSADAKLALCRATLADDSHRTTFECLAAMDYLVQTIGNEALDDLLPLFARDDWRIRDHALAKATEIARIDGGKTIASRFAAAKEKEIQVGILHALGASQSKAGLPVVMAALEHAAAAVRGAAAEPAVAIGGEASLEPVLRHFKTASAADDLRGCEKAILALHAMSSLAPRVRDALIAEVPQSEGSRRESVFWLLGQIGDAPSLAALEQAGQTKVAADFRMVVSALSYSPAIEADAVLLRLAKSDKAKAPLVAAESVRRMVLGPKGFGDRTDDQRIAFAGGILQLAADNRLVTFLGRMGSPRAMPLLVNELRKGFKPAAESVITNAEAMKNLPPADAAIVAQALRDVMEYLEVTVLRGGPDGKDFREYPVAKALQARAGQALVKVHKPEAAPIQGFQGIDIDL